MNKPLNVGDLRDCFGCTVCEGSCPVDIIKITEVKGFLQPIITDSSKCINCGLCLRTCSFNNRHETIENHKAKYFLSSVCKDIETLKTCTSGGLVYELLKKGLELDYVVIAVKYNYESNRPEHCIIETIEELEKTKGSKYIQSSFSGIRFSKDRKYMIIGTPCQIASLYRLLKIKGIKKSILIDFFCHGVPDLRMWDAYLNNYKTGKLYNVSFRPKDYGWHNSLRVKLTGEKCINIIPPPKRDAFFSFFLYDRCLQPACYDSCTFKQTQSFADIRVGDLWGSAYNNNNTGVSGAIVFSEEGYKIVSDCFNLDTKFEQPETILSGQMVLNAKRSLSYRLAQLGLRHNLKLSVLNFFCTLIEDLKYIPVWIKNKVKN